MRSGWVTLGALVTLAIITICLQRYGLSTLAVEHEAIRGWLGGEELYAYRAPGSQAGAALPPAAALLLAPLTLLPLHLTGWLLAVAGIAALLLTVRVVAGPVAHRYGSRRLPFVLVVAALALLAEPVRTAVGQGRTEPLVLALLAADLIGLRRAARSGSMFLFPDRTTAGPLHDTRPGGMSPDHTRQRAGGPLHDTRPGGMSPDHTRQGAGGPFEDTRSGGRLRPFGIGPARLGLLRRAWTSGAWAGAGTGLATAVSVTPVLFIVYLLITGQRRAALTALGTAAAVTVAALAAAPSATLAWFGTAMWELDRAAPINGLGNQSLAGMMARLYDFPAPPVLVWLAVGALLVAIGLIRARTAHSDGDEVAAFTLIGLTTAVAGPVTTAPESLWTIPAVLVLVDIGLRRRRDARLPRPARLAGTIHLAAGALGYLALITTPDWVLRWNIPALALILLVNTLPWRHGTPAPSATVPTPRRAVIPLPRGG